MGTTLSWRGSSPERYYDQRLRDHSTRYEELRTKLEAIPLPVMFVDEGVQRSPEKDASRAIWSAMDVLPSLGFIALDSNANQDAATQSIVQFGERLMDVYVGGTDVDRASDNDDPGNPINERHLIPLLMAWDMVYPRMTPAQRGRVNAFVSRLDARIEAFVGRFSATDGRLSNNWALRGLSTQLYAALVSRNTERVKVLERAIDAAARNIFTTPLGWSPNLCTHLGAIDGFGSRDLQERDALAYHFASLGVALEVEALRPGTFSAPTMKAIEEASLLVRPYVERAKSHQEMLCSSIEFDQTNARYGHVWDPTWSKVPLRFMRLVFPQMRPWLGEFAGRNQAPWVKLLASGRGDVIS